MKISLVAPSSCVGKNELKMGLEVLKAQGFEVDVAKQVRTRHFLYAGSTEERAQALIDAAYDPETEVVWAARGGYGAGQLLPYLENASKSRGLPPRKLYIGYSDSTPLLEFVRTRWSWSSLHAVMPGHRGLLYASTRELRVLTSWIRKMPMPAVWTGQKLKWMGGLVPASSLSGELVGGNLALVQTLLGTPWQMKTSGKLVFFEDLTESVSRIDRMITHLVNAGFFEGVKGVVLGDFLDCADRSPMQLKYIKDIKKRSAIASNPEKKDVERLRPDQALPKALLEIFQPIYGERKIPVAYGLPVGHGKQNAPLPLGAKYELSPEGHFALRDWTWL